MTTRASPIQAHCFWLTGLAGSGKTTLAENLIQDLRAHHLPVLLIDGDVVREIWGHQDRFDRESRLKIARQISNLCKEITLQGIHVVCATISLFAQVHEWNRINIANYHEIFIDVPMDELRARDKKQLYSRAAEGSIKDVVGVDIPFDRPKSCSLTLNNTSSQFADCKEQLIQFARDKVGYG